MFDDAAGIGEPVSAGIGTLPISGNVRCGRDLRRYDLLMGRAGYRYAVIGGEWAVVRSGPMGAHVARGGAAGCDVGSGGKHAILRKYYHI